VGRRLDEARRAFCLDHQVGLTVTYNRLKNPADDDPRVVALRELHLELDRAVLDAYGWSDIPVPLYTTAETDAKRAALEEFEDEVVDRLFDLNAERARLEALQGAAGGAKGRSTSKKAAPVGHGLFTTPPNDES
jgi:hypothetical protein